jgi:tRNA(His) guanylyltransferase
MGTNGKNKYDALSTRMKSYENAYRYSMPRRSYTLIRVDGKAFHTYTGGLKRPFDEGFIDDMNATAAYLCKNMQGAKLAYVQSDEISILLTDFDGMTTQAWFENNVQKMVSVAASMATAKFNQLRMVREAEDNKFYFGDDPDRLVNVTGALTYEEIEQFKLAEFDARVWQIPQKTEVENYFIFRQQDATRNSISAVAQSLYSHKELEGVSSDDKQELIFQKGTNWNDYPTGQKRGRVIERVSELWAKPKGTAQAGNKVADDKLTEIKLMIDLHGLSYDPAVEYYNRTRWEVVECPIFTQDRAFLSTRIKNNV